MDTGGLSAASPAPCFPPELLKPNCKLFTCPGSSGGSSACCKMAGLISALVQVGLHMPDAGEAARYHASALASVLASTFDLLADEEVTLTGPDSAPI